MRFDNASELVHLGGLAVALVGFGITRFVVAGTVDPDGTLQFAVKLVSLVVGLIFTVYGVVLAVGDFPQAYVDTVVRWTFVGVAAMLGVLAVTALGSMTAHGGLEMLRESQLLVANALLGGAVGGALTGDRSGLNRRHRDEIELQAELALIANGLLRHEILNATSIIDGYASLFTDDDSPREADVTAIRRATERIETTVADVGEVGRARDSEALKPTHLDPILREEVAAFGDRYPEADATLRLPDGEIRVLADRRLRLLIRKLLETVAARSEAPTIDIGVSVAHQTIRTDVRSADASIAEIGGQGDDDPAVDFDRRIVELLAEYYDATLEIGENEPGESATAESGPSVTLGLPRAIGDRPGVGRLGVDSAGLGAAIVAGVAGGVTMGVFSQLLTGLLPIIGALYGVSDPFVGWISHLFHSVVFALLFATGYAHFRERFPIGRTATGGLLGVGWGVILWLVAAGVIMPFWLRLVGMPAVLPNLTVVGLVAHLVWGVTVGLLYVPLREELSADGRLMRLYSTLEGRFQSVLD
jgi:signal transduction histidine kinase/uncharacterized membrane protein YagU involved in acid resistance